MKAKLKMFQITPLNKQHNRNQFDCGYSEINTYLKQQANQSAKKSYTKTHVLVDDSTPDQIIGFYTLSSCFIKSELQELININAPYDLCGINLARMGIDKKHQHQSNAQYLIIDAVEKTYQVNKKMGVQGLFLDAKNDSLVKYYEKYGFECIENTDRKMWLPIGVILELVETT